MVERTGPSPIIPDYDSMDAIEVMIEDCQDNQCEVCMLSNGLFFIDQDVRRMQEKLNSMLEYLWMRKHWAVE